MDDLLKFPSSFVIKIMGLNTDTLVTEIASILQSHCKSFNPHTDIVVKHSTKGNYVSISATIEAHSKEHLDTVYIEINKHELVKFVL